MFIDRKSLNQASVSTFEEFEANPRIIRLPNEPRFRTSDLLFLVVASTFSVRATDLFSGMNQYGEPGGDAGQCSVRPQLEGRPYSHKPQS